VDSSITEPRPRRRGQPAGFTIAELILVLVFVGGLLIVVSVSVSDIRKETSTSNCQTELRALKLATEQYHAENDAYPIDKSVLIEGGLVQARAVSKWTVEYEAADRAPTYRAADSSCAPTESTSG
jgi:Tfp pilus assembly protein PilE